MTNMTLAIPDEVTARMKEYSEIRWTEVARKAIEKRLQDLELMDALAKKSKLTHKDVHDISESIKTSAARRLGLK